MFEFRAAIQRWVPGDSLQKCVSHCRPLSAGVRRPALAQALKFAAKSFQSVTKIPESWRPLQQVSGRSALPAFA